MTPEERFWSKMLPEAIDIARELQQEPNSSMTEYKIIRGGMVLYLKVFPRNIGNKLEED